MRLVECITNFGLCFFIALLPLVLIASLPLILITDGILFVLNKIRLTLKKGRPPNEWADGSLKYLLTLEPDG